MEEEKKERNKQETENKMNNELINLQNKLNRIEKCFEEIQQKINGLNEASTIEEMKKVREEIEKYVTTEFTRVEVNINNTLNKFQNNNKSKKEEALIKFNDCEVPLDEGDKQQNKEMEQEDEDEDDCNGEGELEVSIPVKDLLGGNNTKEKQNETTNLDVGKQESPEEREKKNLPKNPNQQEETKTQIKNVVKKTAKRRTRKTNLMEVEY